LTHLTLINFTFPLVFDLPWDFPSLISLQMHVHIYMEPFPQQAEVFGLLTSKCPLLESLDLKVCALKSSLSIHAPKLQNLVLHGLLSRICLEEAKQVKTLSLQASIDTWMEFFTCLPELEKLLLDSWFWEVRKIQLKFSVLSSPYVSY